MGSASHILCSRKVGAMSCGYTVLRRRRAFSKYNIYIYIHTNKLLGRLGRVSDEKKTKLVQISHEKAAKIAQIYTNPSGHLGRDEEKAPTANAH